MSDSISENGPEVKTKISLKTDNQGRELTAAQQEYFKDSKVRDAIRAIIDVLTGREKQQAQTAEGKLTAALEAAAREAESLQNRQENGTIQKAQDSVKGKYWRPRLTQREWSLLNRHMEQEINDPAHALDDATQWAYANEKGSQVFAIYGIGDGTEATPLYVSGGETAAVQHDVLKLWMEGNNGKIDRNRKSLDRILENIKSKSRRAGNDVSAAERGTTANGNVRISLEKRGSNGTANSGSGPENRRVSTRFSLKSPVEETKDLVALHNVTEESSGTAAPSGAWAWTMSAAKERPSLPKPWRRRTSSGP